MTNNLLSHAKRTLSGKLVAATAISAALMTAGCVTGVSTGNITTTRTSEPVSETNFIIGQERTAVVGETVVRVKDYILTRVSIPAVTASTSGSYQLGMGRGTITLGVEYPISGERQIDGRMFRNVNLGPAAAHIFDDGSIHAKGMVRGAYGEWIEPLPNMVVSPSDLRFADVTRVDESSIAAGENYEIIFTGRDASALRFQYREYTSQDMARPAFSQDLSYPIDAPTVRFRGLTIDVISVGPDSITYKVTSRSPHST